MTTPTDRRIAALRRQYDTAAEGFTDNELKRAGPWMPTFEELDRAIQAVEQELEPR